MKNIKVFKIGGSLLTTPDKFIEIGRSLLKYRPKKICLVVSAMKGNTDNLIKTYLSAIPRPDFYNFEQFVGLGEVQSALLFESAFINLKQRVKAILPWMKEWPIYISLREKGELSPKKINERRNFSLLKKSRMAVKKYLLPLLKKGTIIIIPGFVARDSRDRILTLGRGGSDISALLMAELLGAEELVLLKDVKGVMSLDPGIIKTGKELNYLDSESLGLVAASGAQVLNPISLKHRTSLKLMRVVSTKSRGGTEIRFSKEVTVQASKTAFAVLTFIGEAIPETPGILHKISQRLARHDISIYSITISDNLIAIYTAEQRAEPAYRLLSPLLNRIKNLKVLNLKKGIGKIVVRSLKFINEPGIIKKIVTPISKKGINLWEVLTVHTDVMVFVEYKDLKPTYEIIKNIFKEKND